jgi:hypothetical protein
MSVRSKITRGLPAHKGGTAETSKIRETLPVGTFCDHGEPREYATLEDLCLVPTFARLLIAINEKNARQERQERKHLLAFGIKVQLVPPVAAKRPPNGGRSWD